jgi:hypothetical protein
MRFIIFGIQIPEKRVQSDVTFSIIIREVVADDMIIKITLLNGTMIFFPTIDFTRDSGLE